MADGYTFEMLQQPLHRVASPRFASRWSAPRIDQLRVRRDERRSRVPLSYRPLPRANLFRIELLASEERRIDVLKSERQRRVLKQPWA